MPLKHCQLVDKSICEDFFNSFDCVLTDCDGVLWMTDDVIPGCPKTIKMLIEKGKHIIYVTNNSTKDRLEYLKKFERLGYPAQLDDIISTSYCAAIYLQSLNFKKKVYVFGSHGITAELERAGIEFLPIGPDPLKENWTSYVKDVKLDSKVGAVVVGFDEHVSYPKFLKAASYLKDPDCLFVATNKDEQFPSNSDLILPGSGTFVKAIEAVTGRSATSLGKPNKFMFDCVKMKHTELVPERCLMIGDRLNTDILLGTSNNMKTLFVLTGVNSIEDVRALEKSSNPEDQNLVPDYYLPSLADLSTIM